MIDQVVQLGALKTIAGDLFSTVMQSMAIVTPLSYLISTQAVSMLYSQDIRFIANIPPSAYRIAEGGIFVECTKDYHNTVIGLHHLKMLQSFPDGGGFFRRALGNVVGFLFGGVEVDPNREAE